MRSRFYGEEIKRKRRFNNILMNSMRIIVVGVLVVVLFWLCINFIFLIKKVEINGNEKYNDEDIFTISGVKMNGRLYLLDEKKIVTRLMYEMPYISNVVIKKVPFDTLVINVEENTGVFSFEIGDEIYIVSREFRVLARESSVMAAQTDHVIKVITAGISRCFVGRELIFSSIDVKNNIENLYKLIEAYNCAEKINEIDIRNKFKIRFEYENRLSIIISDIENLEIKFLFAVNIINQMDQAQTGILEIISEQEASFKEYE